MEDNRLEEDVRDLDAQARTRVKDLPPAPVGSDSADRIRSFREQMQSELEAEKAQRGPTEPLYRAEKRRDEIRETDLPDTSGVATESMADEKARLLQRLKERQESQQKAYETEKRYQRARVLNESVRTEIEGKASPVWSGIWGMAKEVFGNVIGGAAANAAQGAADAFFELDEFAINTRKQLMNGLARLGEMAASAAGGAPVYDEEAKEEYIPETGAPFDIPGTLEEKGIIEEPVSTAGRVTKRITEFVLPFLGLARGLRVRKAIEEADPHGVVEFIGDAKDSAGAIRSGRTGRADDVMRSGSRETPTGAGPQEPRLTPYRQAPAKVDRPGAMAKEPAPALTPSQVRNQEFVDSAVEGGVAAAGAEYMKLDPYEQQMSSMVLEFFASEGDTDTYKAIVEFLASDPSDSTVSTRFRNAMESVFVDTAVAATMYAAFQAWRAYRVAMGKQQTAEALDAELKSVGRAFAEEAEAENVILQQRDWETMAQQQRPRELTLDEAVERERALNETIAQGSVYSPDDAAIADAMRFRRSDDYEKAMTAWVAHQDKMRGVRQPTAAERLVDEAMSETEGRAAYAARREEEIKIAVERARAEASALEEAGIIPRVDEVVRPQAAPTKPGEVISSGYTPIVDEVISTGTIGPDEAREFIVRGWDEVIKVVEERVKPPKTPKTPKAPKEPKGTAKPEAVFPATPKVVTPEQVEEIISKASDFKVGDSAYFTSNGAVIGGTVRRITDQGKLLIKDDSTGKTFIREPAKVKPEDRVYELDRGFGKDQAGFMNPQMASQLATGAISGLIANASLDKDASFSERLLAIGAAAALGGYSAKKVIDLIDSMNKAYKARRVSGGAPDGAPSVTPPAAHAQAVKEQSAPPSRTVKELAQPEVRGIAPRPRHAQERRVPRISEAASAKATGLWEQAVKSGDPERIASMIEDVDFNLDNIDTQEGADAVIKLFSEFLEPEIKRITGGVRSHDQVEKFAQETGTSVRTLKALYGDVQNLDTRILSNRVLLNAAAKRTYELAVKSAQNPMDDTLALAARKAGMVYATLHARMKSVQTEVARALSAMRIQARSQDLVLNEMDAIFEGMGGRVLNHRYIEQIAAIGESGGQRAIHHAVTKTPWRLTGDVITEVFVSGILSHPSTFLVNTYGGLSHLFYKPTVQALATTAAKSRQRVRRLIGKPEEIDPEQLEFASIAAGVRGSVAGLWDSIRFTGRGGRALLSSLQGVLPGRQAQARKILQENEEEIGSAWRAFLLEEPSNRNPVFTRDENLTNRGKATEEVMSRTMQWLDQKFGSNMAASTWAEYTARALGTVNRIGTRLMLASDEILWAMNARSSLHTDAMQDAIRLGLDGDKMNSFVQDYITKPPEEAVTRSIAAARDGTFMTELTGWWKKLQNTVNSSVPTRIIFPFVRTPINLFSYNVQHTPVINMLSARSREDLMAGGWRRDMAIGRMMVGATTIALAYELYESGHLTGLLPKKSQAERLYGKQSNAVEALGKSVQIRKLDPNVAWFFGLVADFGTMYDMLENEQRDQFAVALIASFSNNVMSKAYLSGMTDMVEALSDKYNAEQAITTWAQRLGVGLTVPSSGMLRFAREEIDPSLREARDLLDGWKNALPGLSSKLPAVYDAFGNQVKVADRTAGTFPTREIRSDSKAHQFVYDLDIDLELPSRSLGGNEDSEVIHMPPEAYADLTRLVGTVKIGGKTFEERVTDLAEQYKGWKRDPSGYKTLPEERVLAWHNQYKRAARRELFKMEKWQALQKANKEHKMNKFRALRGKPTTPPRELMELVEETRK